MSKFGEAIQWSDDQDERLEQGSDLMFAVLAPYVECYRTGKIGDTCFGSVIEATQQLVGAGYPWPDIEKSIRIGTESVEFMAQQQREDALHGEFHV